MARWLVHAKTMNQEHCLEPQATISWVLDSLMDELALSLSHKVAATVQLANMTFRTFAASTASESQLLDFEVGGKVCANPSPLDWLTNALKSTFDWTDCFLIVEDWTARPTDRFISQAGLPAFELEEQVYYIFDQPIPLEINNWRRMYSNTPPLFHGFIISGRNMRPRSSTSLSNALMDKLAHSVKGIFVGVYDGESYVVCS